MLRLAAACLLVAVVAVCTWSAATHSGGPPAQPIPTTDHGTSQEATP